jgi:hypothetical protein
MNYHGEIRFHRAIHINGFALFPKAQESILHNFFGSFEIFNIFMRKKAQSRKMTPEEHLEIRFIQRLDYMFFVVFQC